MIATTVAAAALILIAVLLLRHANQDSGSSQSIVGTVGQLMLLPTNEKPTIATVEDKAEIKDKFLAAHAQDGDRVLIYAKNRLVIVYRPGIHKIAAVGAVTADQAAVEAQNATLTVLDGDSNPTKTQTVIATIKAAYPNLKVTNGGEANRKDFPYTIVIDYTNQKDNLQAALVTALSGKRGIQPPSEDKASTNLLLIVGKD